jgi:hypothetical protein
MKSIIYLSVIVFLTMSLQAQDLKLAIGKTTIDGDAILDFGNEVRGMVISPINDVSAMSPPPSAGTIAFDGNTGSFRFFDGTSWSNIAEGGEITGCHAEANNSDDTFKQIIGAETSSTNGVLIFGKDSGEDQALVLPRLANGNLRFNNPVTGLMYYDTVLKSVMVFNGNSWVSF